MVDGSERSKGLLDMLGAAWRVCLKVTSFHTSRTASERQRVHRAASNLKDYRSNRIFPLSACTIFLLHLLNTNATRGMDNAEHDAATPTPSVTSTIRGSAEALDV